jgi:tRNA uridine 5-carboxymethylaminomethyl modification enzyme
MTALDIARRPNVSLETVFVALRSLDIWPMGELSAMIMERAEIAVKYGSFIEKERIEADRHHRNENQLIPVGTDFTTVRGMRIEAAQKLNAAQPTTIGQAIRTAGVTPSDIGALLVHLTRITARPKHTRQHIAS